MFSTFRLMLAFRYLRPKKKEGFVSLIALFSFLGIALGVATLIIVLSVMNGFKDELLTRILGVNGHMNVYSSHDVIENPDSVAREIRAISGVRKASPIIESQVMISAHGVSFGALAQGLTSTNLATRSLLVANIVSGEIYTKDDSAGVIIGQRLARKLKVDIAVSYTHLTLPTSDLV